MSSPQPPSPRDRPVVLRFDAAGRLCGFTAEARGLFGVDAAALGTPLAAFVAARLDPALAATVTAARDGDAAGGPLVDPCGRHWWYALAAEETEAGGGGLVLTLVAAEASPPPSFTAVMDRADLPAATVDAAGRVRWANPALATRLGAAPAALVGTDWFERCVPPGCRADAEHAVARALAADGPAGDGVRAVEFRLGGGVDERWPAMWHAVGFPSGTAGAV
ncbi:MAG: PAS domain-containing protein, partial [Alphaproteobacteria bacterium]|nr:PAS domain-containing protein [Alphaproteobacteria bacterium]